MSTEYQHIVRIMGNDIPGDKKLIVGLTQIRGVGRTFANTLSIKLNMKPNENIGYLKDDQIKMIEDVIKNPSSFEFPTWFLNRRKDVETGKDLHLSTSDIALSIRNDIERERITNSWRGYRHMFGLKVRGQRTRCTGRKGGAVGVKKGGKVLPSGGGGAGGPAAPAAPTAAAEAKESSAPSAAAEKPKEEKKE